jgi:predicted DNA-binding protein
LADVDFDAHKAKDAQVSVRMPADLLARLTAMARRKGIPRAALLLELLRDGLRRLEEETRSK